MCPKLKVPQLLSYAGDFHYIDIVAGDDLVFGCFPCFFLDVVLPVFSLYYRLLRRHTAWTEDKKTTRYS